MATSNPFQADMVRMQLPPGMGSNISLAGFSLDADEDGCVVVPRAMVGSMESHGLSVATAQAAPEKGKK